MNPKIHHCRLWRGRSGKARIIIEKCAHSGFRPQLDESIEIVKHGHSQQSVSRTSALPVHCLGISASPSPIGPQAIVSLTFRFVCLRPAGMPILSRRRLSEPNVTPDQYFE